MAEQDQLRGRPRTRANGPPPVRDRSPLGQPRPRQQVPAPERQPSPDQWWENARPGERPEERPEERQNEGLLSLLLEKIEGLEKKLMVNGDIIDALHLTVTPDLKEKIWGGKFVDLSALLVKNYQTKKEEQGKRLAGFQDEDGNLTFRSVKPNKSSLSIDQWSSAFNVFISVYIQKKPEEVQGLLAYAELIRGAARDHPTSYAWRQYDEHFRSKKAADPLRPWGMIDNQLWLSMFCKPRTQQSSNQESEKQQSCFYFNSQKGCLRKSCSFSHKCSSCGGKSHNKLKCFSRKDKQNADKSPSKSASHEKEKTAPQDQSFRSKRQ